MLDKNNKLWVLSDGGYQGDANKVVPALTRIDAETFSVEKVFSFSSSQFAPSRLKINGTLDTLYFLSGSWVKLNNAVSGVIRMPVNADALTDEPLIPENSRLFYGLGIDPVNSDIYVTDAIDYQQPGWVYRYNRAGGIVDSFKTDIIPGCFCFKGAPN